MLLVLILENMANLMRKFLSTTIKCFIVIPFFYQYKLKGNNKRKTNKAVVIQVKHPHFKRYLYLFIKFLYLEGYTIYVKPNFITFYNLKTDQFCTYLFSEKIICVDKPPKNVKTIVLDKTVLNANYFEAPKTTAAYYVPMSQHPLMYKENWWNAPIVDEKRKQSVFMAGNFDESTYLAIENDNVFTTISRLGIYSFLANKQLLYSIDSLQKLQTFYESTIDFKIILLNRLKLNVPMDELRHWLAKFDFYFALPGVVMPFSHNIIEAMSVGCIPFIQQSYADMFSPPLINHKQVLTFTDITDLQDKIKYLFALDSYKIAQMRNEVYAYYNNYLTPTKVVQNLEKANFKNIYLQAEHYSVALLKKNKNL